MQKTEFNRDNYEHQLAVLMLEALEKEGILSVTSKRQLEEYVWKEHRDAIKQPA